jgi:hypothetical protein
MAQTNFTPIAVYHSSTPSASPTAGNLVDGELALNLSDGKLFYKDAGGVVQVVASKDAVDGNFTTVDTTNLEVTNVKAKDGTASATIANSTGYWTFSGTGAFTAPVGSTGQRPGSPVNGMLRYNSSLGQFEGYVAGDWGGIGGAQAGGAIMTNKDLASVSYTIAPGENGLSVGPITIDTGVTITVSSGQRWLVL